MIVRRSIKRAGALAAAALLCGTMLSGCAGGKAGAGSHAGGGVTAQKIDAPMPQAPEGLEIYYKQGVTWNECGDGLECGEYKVPLNYADPQGKIMHIAATKHPASGDRIGSLLVNPGGPGASGQELAYVAEAYFPKQIVKHFDIIGFDPRGVGESDPVDCVSDDELYEMVSATFPQTEEGDAASRADAQKFADGCQAESGELLPFIGTENAARDMDVIRAVEGDPKLYYLGFSYGTELGAQYAQLFPKNVGRMVLDGAVASTASNFEQTKQQLIGFESALDEYLDFCFEGGKSCPFAQSAKVSAEGSGNAESAGTASDAASLDASSPGAASDPKEAARAQISELFEQALEHPFKTSDPDEPLTQAGLLYGIITPLYTADEQAYKTLSQAFKQLIEEGDGSLFGLLFDSYLDRTDGEFLSNSMEANLMITCADQRPEGDPSQWKDQEKELIEAAPLFGPVFGYDETMCALWPYHPEQSVGNFHAEGADRIIVIGTKGDPATPYVWAEDLAQSLDASLVTWEGEGHTAYGRSTDCVEKPVTAYLLNGTVPEDGLTCPAE